MKLTVLGSSSAIFNTQSEYRYPAAHLIEHGNSRILLDAGVGVLPQITRLGLTVGDIQTICISHFHADHFAIQPLLQAYFLEGKFADNKPTLHILGPVGIKERVITGFDQSGFSYNTDLVPHVNLTISEYTDAVPITVEGGMNVIPYKTLHYGLDAYALRVEANGKVLAYSGDSTVSAGLENAARYADIFLCEAATKVGQLSDEGHVNPYDAAEVAKRANAKRLVITHYSGFDSEISILENAQETDFGGEITIARDLNSYEV